MKITINDLYNIIDNQAEIYVITSYTKRIEKGGDYDFKTIETVEYSGKFEDINEDLLCSEVHRLDVNLLHAIDCITYEIFI